MIIAPLEGSPAEKAGLKPGDVITAVDGSDARRPDPRRGARPHPRQGRARRSRCTSSGSPRRRPRRAPPATTARPIARTVSGARVVAAPASSPAPARQLIEEFDVTLERAKIQRKRGHRPGARRRHRRLRPPRPASPTTAPKELEDGAQGRRRQGHQEDRARPARQPGRVRRRRAQRRQPVHRRRPGVLAQDAKGKQNEIDADRGGVATDPSIQVVVLIDRGTASAVGDRRRRAPGPGPRQADRRDVVRQGHRPGVVRPRAARRREADRREVADAGQALDPQGRADAGRRR